MSIDLHIAKENIFVHAESTDKPSAITKIVGHVNQTMPIDAQSMTQKLLGREVKRNSDRGNRIAVVHLLDRAVPRLHFCLALFKTPVVWGDNGELVSIVATILSPPRQLNSYLPLILNACKVLADDSVRISILNMDTPAQIMTVINCAALRH